VDTRMAEGNLRVVRFRPKGKDRKRPLQRAEGGESMIQIIMALLMVFSVRETPMTVVDIEPEAVCVVDDNGNAWAFYGDGYELGDEVTVVMYGNTIIDVR